MKQVIKEILNKEKTKYVILGAIIVCKIVLMGIFSSDYQNEMFIPFADTFLNGNDPYKYYYEQNLPSSFPYMPLMLLIESAGGILLRIFHPVSIFARNFLFKTPLLCFDLVGYYILRKMGVRFKYAVVFYFCSPIIWYGTYIHGQLDIIPTILLLISVYYAVSWENKNNLLMYAVFLGFAISTKMHIVAAVPIMFFYIASKKGYLKSIKYLILSGGIVGVFMSLFWSKGFVNCVLFNKEQSILTSVEMNYGTVSLLIPIVALVLVYARAYELNYFNRDLLISILGVLFAIFLICIPAMPAWYIWIVPFLALYFGYVDKEKYKVMLIYAIFNLLYLVYYLFFHKTVYVDVYCFDYSFQCLKQNNVELKCIIFTLMVSTIGVVIYEIYKFGIASNRLYRRGNVPFTIGIAGDSGAGKSTLLKRIENIFGTKNDVLFIEGDGDHRWERNDNNWDNFTALNPKANFLYRQANDIWELRSGNHVQRVEYNHDTGKFSDAKKVRPKKYIVVSGLHTLYLPQMRKEMDLKIYLDTETELRNYWKIQRDICERGYTKEKILEQINKRLSDAEKYIKPQREYADMVISYFDKNMINCMIDEYEVVVSVKFELDINVELEEVQKCLEEYSVFPEHNISENFARQIFIVDGKELEESNVDFAQIARIVIPQYEDLFVYEPDWESGVEGIVQLMILIMISYKMRET